MVDHLSCWFEVTFNLGTYDSLECNHIFGDVRLSRYARLKEVGCDGGGEFVKYFVDLCKDFGLDKKKRLMQPTRSQFYSCEEDAPSEVTV